MEADRNQQRPNPSQNPGLDQKEGKATRGTKEMGSQAVLHKVIPPVCTVNEFFNVIVDVIVS